jgi:hypothetical protein
LQNSGSIRLDFSDSTAIEDEEITEFVVEELFDEIVLLTVLEQEVIIIS